MKFTRKNMFQLSAAIVAIATVIATVIMVMHPNCLTTTLFEVCKGVVGGGIISTLKIQTKANDLLEEPLPMVWRFLTRCSIDEMRFGLVVGYMLGLMHAVWSCLFG